MCSSSVNAPAGPLHEHNSYDIDDYESDNIDSASSLEVDSDDRDSAIGDNQSTYTMSVTSSVYDFRYENGRRYHAYAEGKYPLPNDEIEMDRLDLQHHAFRLTLNGKLCCAPILENVQHVLDVGCGTGIWTIEFADEHPSATVIGTDLSPIQPSSVPPNCSFLIDDCDQDWIYHHQFDYIHTRAMVAAIKNWDRLFEQAFQNLKPGGYLECQELTFPILCHDPTVTAANSPTLRYSSLFVEAAARTGLDGLAPNNFLSKLRAAGFVDIRANNYKWPIGRWAKGKKTKLLGFYVLEDWMTFLPNSMALLTRVLKWSREEVEVFLSECRKEVKEKKKGRHFYLNTYFWVARKPENLASSHMRTQDFVKPDERIEADDSSQGSEVHDNTVAAAGYESDAEAASISSLGTLVEPASDLSIASPTLSNVSPSSPPTASSESRKSMLSMDEMLNPALSTSATTLESVQSAMAAAEYAPPKAAQSSIPGYTEASPMSVNTMRQSPADIVLPVPVQSGALFMASAGGEHVSVQSESPQATLVDVAGSTTDKDNTKKEHNEQSMET